MGATQARGVPSNRIMRIWIFTLLAAPALFAADEQRLALALKAQTEFGRVEAASAPQLRDTMTCVQTQAAMLSVSTPEELPLVHYRLGYCRLAGAAITRSAAEFKEAAGELDKAVEG